MYNIILIMLIISISTMTKAEIKITAPKNGDWVNHLGDTQDLKLEIKGEALNLPKNTIVQLSFNEEISKLKLDKNGKFKFEVDLDSIDSLTENKIRVDALNDGERTESSSVSVYCCSDLNFGYVQDLIPNKSQVIIVKNINNEINGITVSIPKESVRGPANIFITVKTDGPHITATKYSPLSLPIAFGVKGKYYFSENVEYGLIAHFSEPRNGFAEIIPADDWGKRGGATRWWLPWKDAKLKERKIVILGYDGDWKEIKPTKIDGNKVYFKLPKDHYFDRFLPAAVLREN